MPEMTDAELVEKFAHPSGGGDFEILVNDYHDRLLTLLEDALKYRDLRDS